MYYVLLSATGNLIASFRDEAEARAALDDYDPDGAYELALLIYDEDGALVDSPIFATPKSAK